MRDKVASAAPASSEMLEAEYLRMAAVEAGMWWYTTLHASLGAAIARVFGDDRSIRILDAGCGTGGFLRHLRSQGYTNCVGLDISDIAVDFSRKQGFEVIQGSISDPAVLAQVGNVDVIVSMDVICSLPDDRERVLFFREAQGLLNAGGLMIVQTPAFSCLGGIHDMAVGVNERYTKAEMRSVLQQAGIDAYKLRYRLVLLTPVIFIMRALQRLRLRRETHVVIESDVKLPAPLVNTLLALLQRFEDRWLPFKPFGSSLQIVIAKRQAQK